MANASGAVLAVYLKRVTLSHEVYLGTLSAVVLGHDLVRLGLYWSFDLLNETALKTAVVLLPFVFGGGWVGSRLPGIVSERALARIVLSLVIIVGSILMF
jgi:uncharacterized membrane protein YfcA